MGLDIDRDHFDEADYDRFRTRLDECLEELRGVVARPDFGRGPTSIGSELELHLVDARGAPKPINRDVIARAAAPVTTEIDRFNLELNTAPLMLAGRPFTALRRQLDDALGDVARAAAERQARVASIGILPTLRESDLGRGALTDSCRYRALSEAIRRLRCAPFHLAIQGEDVLDMMTEDVTFGGATAALQVHLKVPPERFADCYNAAQIAVAPVLACSTNSPLFLGRRLWEETRIALFRQAVDERHDDWRPARVTFGHGWVRQGVVELFDELVSMYEPLLPIVDGHSNTADPPRLDELRLHNGTMWRWNRPVYDPVGRGHLRIEMRAFPSGPTVPDMVATSAFAIGATLGLSSHVEELQRRMTFGHARQNFYEAARLGLDASLLWPQKSAPSPSPMRASEVAASLLPIAHDALVAHGVEPDEADAYLSIVERSIARRATGARWQRAAFEAFGGDAKRMFERYLALSESDLSVAEWPMVAS